LTLALPGGALGVLGVQLQIFPVNYAKFFYPPWGCRCTHCIPWLYAYDQHCVSLGLLAVRLTPTIASSLDEHTLCVYTVWSRCYRCYIIKRRT